MSANPLLCAVAATIALSRLVAIVSTIFAASSNDTFLLSELFIFLCFLNSFRNSFRRPHFPVQGIFQGAHFQWNLFPICLMWLSRPNNRRKSFKKMSCFFVGNLSIERQPESGRKNAKIWFKVVREALHCATSSWRADRAIPYMVAWRLDLSLWALRNNTYQVIQAVTFSSPSWRSLNPLKGSLNRPKKVGTIHWKVFDLQGILIL